jgi:hypothetical protein
MLNDFMFEEDPMTISNNHCSFVMDMARRRAREQIRVPCDVSDDMTFMHDVENLGLLTDFYRRRDDFTKSRELMVRVTSKIGNKCFGLQNTLENPIVNS